MLVVVIDGWEGVVPLVLLGLALCANAEVWARANAITQQRTLNNMVRLLFMDSSYWKFLLGWNWSMEQNVCKSG